MRLIQPNSLCEEDSKTPASVFESKYDWLLRWAMHFTRNDRDAAEDLVQDTFVRLIASWPRIKDNIDQAEPFLYSTLKYAHLMELRRGRRLNFQNLALIEFDDLRMSLREEAAADPIELQDSLRRIVAYLCWRKQSVKSASALLLRFFHGYFPDEIAQIARMKRGSIDELLRVAREDVKSYLAAPSRIEFMHRGRPPELIPRQIAIPPELFTEEMRATIFQARTAPCLDRGELLRRYQAIGSKSISTELLGHIVSCERCLAIVNSIFSLAPPSERTMGQMTGSSPRSKGNSGSGAPASKEEIRRTIAGGMARFRKLYEHRPRGLMVVVNGDVLAMRDINSATSELKVQTATERSLGIIDVVSEQGISLLSLHVPALPPEAPPELRQEISLSGDRTLELLLRFTAEGAVVELHYDDPSLLVAAENPDLQPWHESEEPSEEFVENFPESEISPAPSRPRRFFWPKRLLGRLAGIAMPEMSPMLATAMICGVAACVLFFLSFRASSVMKPDDLLRQVASAETSSARAGINGVVVQTIRIQTQGKKTERTLYRDVQGRRRLKERVLGKDEAALRLKFETAGISWNDPLSASSFRDWHDRAVVQREVVKHMGKGLLTLTTVASDGDVASESITVRETDFHLVGKTVELRNKDTVEIAELNFSILPWSFINPDLFEPIDRAPSVVGRGMHGSLSSHLPVALGPAEIDEAELGARLVLNHLHFDTNGRIEMTRQPDGVHIRGVVDTDEEKHQLQSQLHLVPHVLPHILTIREMESRPDAASDVTSVQQSSVAVAEPSSLEKYAVDRGMERAAVSVSAQDFMDGSFTVRHESKEIADLLQQFSNNVALSPTARTALSELLIQHKAALLAALGREERQLLTLQLISHPTSAEQSVQGNPDGLRAAAEQNFTLCVDLTSGGEAPSRSAQSIAPQLANSIAQLRAIVLHISAAAQMYPPSSANAATANQNK